MLHSLHFSTSFDRLALPCRWPCQSTSIVHSVAFKTDSIVARLLQLVCFSHSIFVLVLLLWPLESQPLARYLEFLFGLDEYRYRRKHELKMRRRQYERVGRETRYEDNYRRTVLYDIDALVVDRYAY
jgi:hypothetical protein